MYKAKVGDIVEGTTNSGRHHLGRGEVIAVGDTLRPEDRGGLIMAKVKYDSGIIAYHFAIDSKEIKFIGRKIPVLNLTDII